MLLCRRSGRSPRAAFYATHGANDKTGAANRRRGAPEEERDRRSRALPLPLQGRARGRGLRFVAGWLWSGALLVLLGFLVPHPRRQLLSARFTNTNPVVMVFGVFVSRSATSSRVSASPRPLRAGQFADRLHRPANPHRVVIGLCFFLICPCAPTRHGELRRRASLIPRSFVPPLVAVVAWSLLGLALVSSSTPCWRGPGSHRRSISYSMTGLILGVRHVLRCTKLPLGLPSPPRRSQPGSGLERRRNRRHRPGPHAVSITITSADRTRHHLQHAAVPSSVDARIYGIPAGLGRARHSRC